ncbi:MAG: nucleoside hydrolase [Halobacteriales archaeon]
MPDFPTLSTADRLDRLAPPEGEVPVVLDTDAHNEIDDQYAIAYALSAPDMAVEAIHAAPFDNDRSEGPADGMERSHAEIERVRSRLGADVPVREGSRSYLTGADEPVGSPAREDLIERARATDGPLYVVAIGAPTNVAAALEAAPDLVGELVVVWLGGTPHDWPTAREFNLRQDPRASRTLLDAGVPLVHVPCRNVAEHLRISLPELRAHLDPDEAAESYLIDIVEEYLDGPGPARSTVVWDVVAVAALRDPALVSTAVVHSPELTADLTWNRDPARHFVRVARRIDRDGIWNDVLRTLRAA